MLREKFNRLLPIGLLMLAAGLILHNFTHNHAFNFGAGFLIGMALVFMIAGFVSMSRRRV
jgi:hypothetical protein